MKKESLGLTLSLMLLFGGYITIQNHYFKQQTIEIQKQTQSLASPPIISQTIINQTSTTPPKTNSVQTPAPAPKILNPLTIKSPEDLKLSVSTTNLNWTPIGGCLGQNELTKEQLAYNDKTPVSVISNHKICKSFGFRVGDMDLRNEKSGITKTSSHSIEITQRTQNLQITRSFNFSDTNYNGIFRIEITNISNQDQSTHVDFNLGASSDNITAQQFVFLTAPSNENSPHSKKNQHLKLF